jgi:SAM-dependent methyltransferase
VKFQAVELRGAECSETSDLDVKMSRDYWDSLHREHPGEFTAVGYAALGEGFNREAYRRLRFPALRRLLHHNHVAPRALLEAGVGTGAYAGLWRELGVREWVGLDMSPCAIAHCRRRFPDGEFHVVDLGQPEKALEGRCFDLVTAIDVLYHIVDDVQFETALAWLASRVGEHGYLVVSDVFTDSAWGRRFAHVKRRPMDAYLQILEPCGLRLVDQEPVFAILGDPVPDGRGRGRALFLIWRVLQKSIRMMPEGLRSAYGGTVVRVFYPLDRLIRSMTDVRGINLELALFARQASGWGR